MDILFLLIPIAIGFLIIALAVFFWAIRDGQYDDMESQGLKVIIDDKQQTQAEKRPSQAINNPDDPN
ncbi:MAG: cbb3-type cytochrome oxidase assembly protein CcoS [Gammaproteobacteria bacterium]